MKLVLALALSLPVTLSAQSTRQTQDSHWVASWSTSAMAPEPQNNQPGIDPAKLTDVTIRNVIHLSAGGPSVRIHLSNAFGTRALTVDNIHLARATSSASSAIDSASDRTVTFAGQPSVTIPDGAEMISDPIPLPVAALADLAVTFHLLTPPSIQTLHPGSHATTYLLHGTHSAEHDLPDAEKIEHWYQIAAVDVSASPAASTIVAFGDSITDGHASTTNGNDRWPDVLAARLQAAPATRMLAVVNQGIGGNHLLTDGLGINALARMDRDVLAQSGIRTILLFEGINDVGMLARGKSATPADHTELVARMISAYQQIILRAHAHGIRVIGCTMTPFVGSDYYAPTPASEADRVAVNEWIRKPGNFDATIDLAQVIRDPAHPDRMLPAADSGDHLHPGPAGYKMMGDAIPLALFR